MVLTGEDIKSLAIGGWGIWDFSPANSFSKTMTELVFLTFKDAA
jgi:hypothetical protein